MSYYSCLRLMGGLDWKKFNKKFLSRLCSSKYNIKEADIIKMVGFFAVL